MCFLNRLCPVQIVATGALSTSLQSLRSFVHERLQEHKDRIGFNLAAARYHDRVLTEAAAKLPSGAEGPAIVPKPIRLGKRKDLALL